MPNAPAPGRTRVIIIGAIAELEQNLIIERVRAGMRRARLEGRRIGRDRSTWTARLCSGIVPAD